jgi:hypothetical protein
VPGLLKEELMKTRTHMEFAMLGSARSNGGCGRCAEREVRGRGGWHDRFSVWGYEASTEGGFGRGVIGNQLQVCFDGGSLGTVGIGSYSL